MLRIISRVCLLLSVVAALAALPDDARGQAGVSYWMVDDSVSASLHGDYKVRFVSGNKFLLDAEGMEHDPGEWVYHRLRVDPALEFSDRFRLASQLDIVDGNVWGQTSAVAADYLLTPRDDNWGLASFEVRKLYVQWDTPVGRLTAGRQTSRWGLGILANGGEEDSVFADARTGDIVERVMFATYPARLFCDCECADRLVLVFGADVVHRDENADYAAGDRAYQGVSSLYYHDDSLFIGAYGAYRAQDDREERLESAGPDGDASVAAAVPRTSLDVWAMDLFFRWTLASPRVVFAFAGEGVYILGETTRGINESQPDKLDVRQFGGALEARLEFPDSGIQTALEAGYASEDSNTTDGVLRGLKFDPSFRVGMILFEDVLNNVSAYWTHRLADPGSVAVPPSGVRNAPTNGAVANAFYVAPTLLFNPLDSLQLQLGGVWAMTPEGVADPYRTASLHGGQPVTSWDGEADTSVLGYEIDAGIKWILPLDSGPKMSISAQAGGFLPGGALDGPGGAGMEPVWKSRLLLDLGW